RADVPRQGKARGPHAGSSHGVPARSQALALVRKRLDEPRCWRSQGREGARLIIPRADRARQQSHMEKIMKSNRLFEVGSILLVAGILIAAYVAAGGFKGSEQRCAAYKTAYDEWIDKGKPGGAAEARAVETAYRSGKFLCS